MISMNNLRISQCEVWEVVITYFTQNELWVPDEIRENRHTVIENLDHYLRQDCDMITI